MGKGHPVSETFTWPSLLQKPLPIKPRNLQSCDNHQGCCKTFLRASITKYYRLRDSNDGNLFSRNNGGQKYKIKVLAELVSPKDPLLDFIDGHLFPASYHGLPSVCVYILISSSYRDINHIGFGPIYMTSFYPNCFFKKPISK